jgi:predicted metal-dependent hydrolase
LPTAHGSYRLKTTAILSAVQLALPFSVDSANAQPAAELPQPSPPTIPLYFVRHRRARRYLLRVEPDGRVRVTIPRGGSKREADAFAVRHLDWIVRQRARLPEPSATDAEERRALIQRAKQELPIRVMQLAAAHGVAVTRVSIRNQRSRWGSCGRDGHICLNWRLVRMPEWVCDYVIVHELMHVRRMDHSAAYWKLVAEACPDYQSARAWLRVHGRTL